MKLVSYSHGGVAGAGVLEEDWVTPLRVASLHELLTSRPRDVSLVAHAASRVSSERVSILELHLTAPVMPPGRNVFAVGWNYTDHFAEGAVARNDDQELPSHPTFFTKTPESVVGPSDDIEIDTSLTSSWDYEAEIAIVLSSGGRNIPLEEAESHIAGFMLANDVTARDIQRRHGGQWFKGKSMDNSSPLGPALVTPDELPDGRPRGLSLSVDGRVCQSASTAEMYFDFSRIIADLSIGMTLRTGDVILTGTPSGVGYVQHPPMWLEHGQEVVVSSPDLGELRNRVVDRVRSVK